MERRLGLQARESDLLELAVEGLDLPVSLGQLDPEVAL